LPFIGRGAPILLLLAVLSGCSTESHLPPPVAPTESRATGATRRQSANQGDTNNGQIHAGDPGIVVDGRPIPIDELEAHLREIAGAEVIADLVLSEKLRRELDRRGLVVTEADIEHERNNLVGAIQSEAATDPNTAEQLLADIRLQRGLGPSRFPALLERNAMLRRLARARIADAGEFITEEDVQRRYQVLHGKRYVARVITLATEREAGEVRRQLGDTPSLDTFAAMAVRVSTDASGIRGGSLEPISPLDPAYESIVRRSLDELEEGQASHVVAIEGGFAIFLLERTIPPSDKPLRELSDAIRADLELRQERVFMDRFAKELLAEASVTIFDRSLEWSWQAR